MHNGKYPPFFKEPAFSVVKTGEAKYKLPKVNSDDNFDLVLLRLAKAGYYKGEYETLQATPIDVIMKLLHYENFCNDYQEQYYEINKGEE